MHRIDMIWSTFDAFIIAIELIENIEMKSFIWHANKQFSLQLPQLIESFSTLLDRNFPSLFQAFAFDIQQV